jgi:hypothetical protein
MQALRGRAVATQWGMIGLLKKHSKTKTILNHNNTKH